MYETYPFVNVFPKGLCDCAVTHFKSDSGENNEGDVTEIVSVNELPRGGISMFGGLASSSRNSSREWVASDPASSLCIYLFMHILTHGT